MRTLENQIDATGKVNNIDTAISGSSTTQVLDSLGITKVPSVLSWAGGELTFTITITNNEPDPYTGVTLTDTLDITKFALDTTSITIKGVAAVEVTDFDYTPATGVLNIHPQTALDIPTGESAIITFKGTKVAP